ncbi:unnamed protein product [Closterium sp. Naga37s-1]|nr:unnamed protein product [Closterium sp. Naga37s-1]
MFSAHPDLHEVDTILSHRDTSVGREYLIHWRNTSASEDSWEPFSNLSHAPRAIGVYLASLAPRTVPSGRGGNVTSGGCTGGSVKRTGGESMQQQRATANVGSKGAEVSRTWGIHLCTCFYCTGFWTADSHPYGAGALFTQAEDADVVEVHGMFTQAEAEVHGMFTQAEVHGMFTQAEVHGMFTQAEVHGMFTQAEAEVHGMFTQAEVHGMFTQAEVHGMFTQAEVHGMFTQAEAEVHGILQAKLGKAAGCWESGTSKGRIGGAFSVIFFLKSKQRAKDACGEKGVGSTRVTSRIQGAVKLVEGQGAERARRSSEG